MSTEKNDEAELFRSHIPADSLRLDAQMGFMPFETPDRLNLMAVEEMERGHQEMAECLWEIALMKDPTHADSLFNRELMLLRCGCKAPDKVQAELQVLEEEGTRGLTDAVAEELGWDRRTAEQGQSYRWDKKWNFAAGLLMGEKYVLAVYENGTLRTGRFDTESGQLRWQGSADFIPPGGLRGCAVRANGEFCAGLTGEGVPFLVDAQGGVTCGDKLNLHRRGEEEKTNLVFSPDGSRLAVGEPVYYDRHWPRTVVLEIPSLRVIADVKMTFVCMMRENACLVRGKEEGKKREALYLVETDGSLREMFRFEQSLETTREYQLLPAPFLCYAYKKTGECFWLDARLQKRPMRREIFDEIERTPFYDPIHERLYTHRDGRELSLWDLNTQEKLIGMAWSAAFGRDQKYAVLNAWNGYTHAPFLIGAEPDGDGWSVSLLSTLSYKKGIEIWKLPGWHRPQPVQWRRAVSVEKPTAALLEETVRLQKQTEACLAHGELSEALTLWRRYREIPAAFGCADYAALEDAVDRATERAGLYAVRETGSLPALPPMAMSPDHCLIPGEEKTRILCKTHAPDVSVCLFREDGTLLRELQLPVDACYAAVRGGKIYVFFKNRDCLLMDLNGRPLPLPWEDWPQEYTYYDLDAQGRRLLYEESFRTWPHVRQKDLETGVELRIHNSSAFCRYMSDDSILLGDGDLVKQHNPRSGEVTASFRTNTKPDMTLVNPERTCLLTRYRTPKDAWTVRNTKLETICEWTDPACGARGACFIPGSDLLACTTEVKADSTEEELTLRSYLCGTKLFSARVAKKSELWVSPDSRELYVRSGERVRVFHLCYEYTVRE